MPFYRNQLGPPVITTEGHLYTYAIFTCNGFVILSNPTWYNILGILFIFASNSLIRHVIHPRCTGKNRERQQQLLFMICNVFNHGVPPLMAWIDRGHRESAWWITTLLGLVLAEYEHPRHVFLNSIGAVAVAVWSAWLSGREMREVLEIFVFISSVATLGTGLLVNARHSRDQMRRALDRQQLYLAQISHELRTPLTGILGITGLLKEEVQALEARQTAAVPQQTPTLARKQSRSNSSHSSHSSSNSSSSSQYPQPQQTTECSQLLDTLSVCTKALLHISNDVLFVAKLEAGALQVKSEPIALVQLVDSVASLARASAINLGRMNLRISCELGQQELHHEWLNADHQRIRQMLTNLMNNAVKFTQEGSVKLIVTRRPCAVLSPALQSDEQSSSSSGSGADSKSEAAPRRMHEFTFEVRDTGCGVSESKRDKLFEPFVQGENHEVQGTGLGLYITRKLAEAIGGSVTLQANFPVGSVFKLVLPLESCDPPANANSAAADEHSRPLLSNISTIARRSARRLTINANAAAASESAEPSFCMSLSQPSVRRNVEMNAEAADGDGTRLSNDSPLMANRLQLLRDFPHSSLAQQQQQQEEEQQQPDVQQQQALSAKDCEQALARLSNGIALHGSLTESLSERKQTQRQQQQQNGSSEDSMQRHSSSPARPRMTRASSRAKASAAAAEAQPLQQRSSSRSNGSSSSMDTREDGGDDHAGQSSSTAAPEETDTEMRAADGNNSSNSDSGNNSSNGRQSRKRRGASAAASSASTGSDEPGSRPSASKRARVDKSQLSRSNSNSSSNSHSTAAAATTPEPLPILLVEDVSVSRQVIARMIARVGLTCHEAENGAEAVEKCRHQQYQLILMDCAMPVMDGYEATRQIRASNAVNKRTRIVALTASVLPGDREKCLAAGMDCYCAKPVTFEALRGVIFYGHPDSHPPPLKPLAASASATAAS